MWMYSLKGLAYPSDGDDTDDDNDDDGGGGGGGDSETSPSYQPRKKHFR